MDRTAIAPIQGFYYQFLTTVKYCLDLFETENKDKKILCEGAEDLDIYDEGGKTYIQVKKIESKLSLNSKEVRKTLLGFFREFMKDKSVSFVFHTNSQIGRETGYDEKKTKLLELWQDQRSLNWKNEEKLLLIVNSVRSSLNKYMKIEGIDDLDLSQLNENFIKRVTLSFNQDSLSSYEPIIKDRLSHLFKGATKTFIDLIFLNLVHLVITKSISKNREERFIDASTIISLHSRIESELSLVAQQLVFVSGDKSVSINLFELDKKIDELSKNSREALDILKKVIGQETISHSKILDSKSREYEEYPFVTKLNDAKMPIKVVLESKDHFYQTEYALTKAEVISSPQKKSELVRLRKSIIDMYNEQYNLAVDDQNTSSVRLLMNIYGEIRRNNNGSLVTIIPFADFHKIGLLHHIANEEIELIWRIIR